MWLSTYLRARSDVSADAETGPETSWECLLKWSTFLGFRTQILSQASTFLQSLQEGYMEKFSSLPENVFTRAMMVFGLVIGPFAPIPILAVDLAVLLAMTVVFAAGWIVGTAVSGSLAGLVWIVNGTDAAGSVFKTGTDVTEGLLFFVLNLLRIPAGIANLIGFIPSFILESITEGINYGAVSAVYSAYNCRGCTIRMPESLLPQNNTARSNNTINESTPVQDRTQNPTMLHSFTSSTAASSSMASEALVDAACDTTSQPATITKGKPAGLRNTV